MTPELHAMLLSWAAGGDEIQRRHAAYRLSLPDAIGYVPPPEEARAEPPAAANPPPSAVLAALKLVKQCPWRSVDPPCGCSGARCALRFARGATGQIVSSQECIACVETYGLA